MANVTVTILKSGRFDKYGRPYVVDNTYSVEFNEAKSLWQARFASVADSKVFDDDNTPNEGVFLRSLKFTEFKKCLLASLAANSTASRSNGIVTITATAHNITTGTTYAGYRFFYPGSAGLAAGWYDSITSVPDANTITFSAPGADFGSQSVNSASAYTTATTVPGVGVIPAYSWPDTSTIQLRVCAGGSTAALTKTIRPLINGNQLSAVTSTSSPFSVREWELIPIPPSSVASMLISFSGASGSLPTPQADRTADISLTLQLTLASAGDFITITCPPTMVL